MVKESKNKVSIKENKIIYIKVAEEVSEKEVFDLLDEIEEDLEALGKEAEVLVNITTNVVIRSSAFRKELAARVRDLFDRKGFRKVSLFAPHLATRTIASFVIAITKLDNIKVFKSEEEALSWLKE